MARARARTSRTVLRSRTTAVLALALWAVVFALPPAGAFEPPDPALSGPSSGPADLGDLEIDWATVDTDEDGVPDGTDNCPFTANPRQADLDGDGEGDACEDQDKDGIADLADNCPFLANPQQIDRDLDGVGDACQDTDGDGIADLRDNCPRIANKDQADSDFDGTGDACSTVAAGSGADAGAAIADFLEGAEKTAAGGLGNARGEEQERSRAVSKSVGDVSAEVARIDRDRDKPPPADLDDFIRAVEEARIARGRPLPGAASGTGAPSAGSAASGAAGSGSAGAAGSGSAGAAGSGSAGGGGTGGGQRVGKTVTCYGLCERKTECQVRVVDPEHRARARAEGLAFCRRTCQPQMKVPPKTYPECMHDASVVGQDPGFAECFCSLWR
jgi:hypothetical protein